MGYCTVSLVQTAERNVTELREPTLFFCDDLLIISSSHDVEAKKQLPVTACDEQTMTVPRGFSVSPLCPWLGRKPPERACVSCGVFHRTSRLRCPQ